MKENLNIKVNDYQAPAIEVIEVTVEKGFALSDEGRGENGIAGGAFGS